MKTYSTIRILPLLAALLAPALLSAQTATVDPTSFTRRAGEREFTLGGAGASNRSMDDSFGGVNFSYGWYSSETQAWVIRQSINYSNPDVGSRSWNGSTRVAFDQHILPSGAFRPFVGVSAGGIYGDNVRDSFVAGLEAGVKYYVQPRTFVYAMADWGWTFRHARNLSDRFSSGQYTWGLGLGFNF